MKNIKIIKLLLTVIFAILASSNMMLAKHISHKVYGDPPEIVYRMDTKGNIDPAQNEIFNLGFRARGTEDNLAIHVLGDGKNDVFISTTEREEFLTQDFVNYPQTLLEGELALNPPAVIYIYTMIADDRFYDVARSMEEETLTRTEELMINTEHEWAALQYIPSSYIIRAVQYNYDQTRGIYIMGETIENPHYDEDLPESTGNVDPYPIVDVPAFRRTDTVVTANYDNVAGANFCPPSTSSSKGNIVYSGIRGSCAYPLVLNADHFVEELKAYKNYMLSNKLGYIKAWSHDEL